MRTAIPLDSVEHSSITYTGVIIGCVGIFFGIAVLVYVLLFRRDDSTSVKIKENFGVIPNTAGSVLANCGATKDNKCEFSVATVADAIDLCNAETNCNGFSYESSSGNAVMSILTNSPTLSPQTGTDVYLRQVALA